MNIHQAEPARPKQDERDFLNRALQAASIPRLDSPDFIPALGGLIRQIVTDHDHFRSIINRTQPEIRVTVYEAMKPHLRFEAKPLDVYVAEIAEHAARMNLPKIGPDGKYYEQAGQMVNPDSEREENTRLNQLCADSIAKWRLVLVCKSCTKEATFSGVSRAAAVEESRKQLWKFDRSGWCEYCPECRAD